MTLLLIIILLSAATWWAYVMDYVGIGFALHLLLLAAIGMFFGNERVLVVIPYLLLLVLVALLTQRINEKKHRGEQKK